MKINDGWLVIVEPWRWIARLRNRGELRKLSAWARGTVGNCFRPSASLTVGLWVCGTRFVEACGQWEQGTKVYKVTRGYKDYKVRS